MFYNDYVIVDEPLSNQLEIISNDTPKCLNPFDISVINASGASGFWSGTGPSVPLFSNPSNPQTTVSVTAFGTYSISYTDDCGEQVTTYIEMNTVPPEVGALPSIVFVIFKLL